MQQNKGRLKVLFLPAWYPSEVNPVAGIFVKEHARAASLYNDIVVLYAYPDPSPKPWKLYRNSEDVEDGIRTIRVRYGGIFPYLWRKLTRGGNGKGTSSSLGSKHATISGKLLRIPRVVIGDPLYFWGIFTAFRRMKKEGWKPDIIHAHVFTAAVPAVLLGKLYGIPVVHTEHYTMVATHSLSFLERMKTRFALNRVRMVLPVSDDLRTALGDYYQIRSTFRVIPNVVNTEGFYPLALETEGRRLNTKRLLLVANLVSRKGIPYLLEALSQVYSKRQDFTMDVVGDGPNRQEYEDLASELGLGDAVRFHGRQPEVASFMRQCDFFVLPSLYENFGVVYIEAMACGKPVIATNAGGPKEIVSEEVGIVVPPEDVNALTEAIEFMLDHHEDYSSERLARYARERFGYETVGKMLDEVYGETVGC